MGTADDCYRLFTVDTSIALPALSNFKKMSTSSSSASTQRVILRAKRPYSKAPVECFSVNDPSKRMLSDGRGVLMDSGAEQNGSTCFRYRGTASSLSQVNSTSTVTDGLEVDKATSPSISRTFKALAINPDSPRGKIPCTVSRRLLLLLLLSISPMPELCGYKFDECEFFP